MSQLGNAMANIPSVLLPGLCEMGNICILTVILAPPPSLNPTVSRDFSRLYLDADLIKE